MGSDQNPWEVLTLRRKIKKFESTGLNESIRLLKKVK